MVGAREIEIPGGHNLTIHELDNVYDSLTGRALTGSWLWDSALVLSHWMASSAHLHFPLRGTSVLELGAGTGLPSLTAALLGAARVVLTDVGPILPGLAKNVEANGLGNRVEVRELVWGSVDEDLTQLGRFDLVLMSDVFIDPGEMPALAETLETVCREGTRIWAAGEVRTGTGECLSELVNRGFTVDEVLSQPSAAPSTSQGDDDSGTFAVYNLVLPRADAPRNSPPTIKSKTLT
ncbi:protein N-lysine methyltransferase METTL21A-like [Punica granatum]|uniref:Uncharacterized protein n=2 Tax=Punica granatum TaxID=22663 RepID=A0A2I0ISE8_PUNGR|nr:protein N-lysine methyltransferase METTL21A-like [Punica granatum]PKI46921.1 hypothetical protein CRG98_032732 [Punica granatum]